MKLIKIIFENYNIDQSAYELYGNYSAKVNPIYSTDHLTNEKRLVLITAISPTPHGEGKTTIGIGLSDSLNKLQKGSCILCLRQPSIGPSLGFKGGASGAGFAKIVPEDLINLGLNGDNYVVGTINNLISSIIDNVIFFENELNIDPTKIIFKRVLDINDRSLRGIKVTINSKKNISYTTDVNITAASEIMAILCLSKDSNDFIDKVNSIIVAYTFDNKPVYVKQFNIGSTIRRLTYNLFMPNAVQTGYGNMCFLHGGPFANIAHGCSSIISTNTAFKYADLVVTEAGFGSDLGLEKYIDIVGDQYLNPNCVVLCVTTKALIFHGKENENKIEQLKSGFSNLLQHINNIRSFGVELIVAINKFVGEKEQAYEDVVVEWLKNNNIEYSLCDVFNNGETGALDLAKKILNDKKYKIRPTINKIYELTDSLENKIRKIAKRSYGISNITFTEQAKIKLEEYKNIPYYVCMAKTPLSFSSNPKNLIFNPNDEIVIKNIELNNGAKLLIPISDGIWRMPGLPKQPRAQK